MHRWNSFVMFYLALSSKSGKATTVATVAVAAAASTATMLSSRFRTIKNGIIFCYRHVFVCSACVCVVFVTHSYFSMDLLVNRGTRIFSFSLRVQPKYLFVIFFLFFFGSKKPLQFVLDFVCYLCIHNTHTVGFFLFHFLLVLCLSYFATTLSTKWRKKWSIFISNIVAVFVWNEIDRIYSVEWQMLSISLRYFLLSSFFRSVVSRSFCSPCFQSQLSKK